MPPYTLFVCGRSKLAQARHHTPLHSHVILPFSVPAQASAELSDSRNRLNYYQLVLSQRRFLKEWFASNGVCICVYVCMCLGRMGQRQRHHCTASATTIHFTKKNDTHPILTTYHFPLTEPNVRFVMEIVSKRKAELSEGIRADQKDVLTLMLTASDPQCVWWIAWRDD
jgi:hypothetical protein